MGRDWKRRLAAVEMTGWTGGGWTVLERAGHDAGTVTWRARHACGAVDIVKGTALRHRPPKYCSSCRPKPPGTVERTGKLRPKRKKNHGE